jgi:homospermidine synthase
MAEWLHCNRFLVSLSNATYFNILGALIMGHPFQSWWIGTKLSIHEARKLVPHQNATTIQVAISIISALLWMIQHPSEGVLTSEALPHEDMLRVAKPYLGQFISTRSDWTPLKHYHNAFKGHNSPNINEKDVWQFKNFLITDMD